MHLVPYSGRCCSEQNIVDERTDRGVGNIVDERMNDGTPGLRKPDYLTAARVRGLGLVKQLVPGFRRAIYPKKTSGEKSAVQHNGSLRVSRNGQERGFNDLFARRNCYEHIAYGFRAKLWAMPQATDVAGEKVCSGSVDVSQV